MSSTPRQCARCRSRRSLIDDGEDGAETWLGDYPPQDSTTSAGSCFRCARSGASSCETSGARSVEDGARLNVDEPWLRRLALERYAGGGRLSAATLQTKPDIASRASGPVWQAQFDDAQCTALYFAADDDTSSSGARGHGVLSCSGCCTRWTTSAATISTTRHRHDRHGDAVAVDLRNRPDRAKLKWF